MISHTRRPRGPHRQNKPEERVKRCLSVPFINGRTRPRENGATRSRSQQTRETGPSPRPSAWAARATLSFPTPSSTDKVDTGNLWVMCELKLRLLNHCSVALLQDYPCTSFSMSTFTIISPMLYLKLRGNSVIPHQKLPTTARVAFTAV